MPKPLGLPSLNLSSATTISNQQPLSPSLSPESPTSPRIARSNPGSPHLSGLQTRPDFRNQQAHSAYGSASPQVGAMPPTPDHTSPKHSRDPNKSFFSNLMASKSSHRLHSPDASIPESGERTAMKSRASSKDRSLHSLRHKESTPDIPRATAPNSSSTIPLTSEPVSGNGIQASGDTAQEQWVPKGRSRLGGIMHRTRSIRLDDAPKYKARSPSQLNLDPVYMQAARSDAQYAEPVKTAPIRSDHRERAFADDGGSVLRNRSADRQYSPRYEDTASVRSKIGTGGSASTAQSYRDGSGLLSNLQHTGKGMGDRLGRAGKGLFGKITRSGSTNERELVSDDYYTCSVITLPLVKQTRKTRIARRLELSKDKTEFWMPALPWRCIDYLNMNGCEEEGLYRIPGSGREVKRWQRRFDTEYDIDLFNETELYDINTIGSMFKAWLRDLPDEILPKTVQVKVATECAGVTTVPKLLKDELSKLPPFNYYLLFAITCHLSLLHSFADKNKMDYRNLCICFQPCLKIDAFCFQFLVQDWKSCWQGCWTEKAFLEEEYRYEREGSTHGSGDDHSADERAISSSGSSQHVPVSADSRITDAHRKASLPRSVQRKASSSAGMQLNGNGYNTNGNGNVGTAPAVPRVLRTPEPQIMPPEQLPELKGLSPIKF